MLNMKGLVKHIWVEFYFEGGNIYILGSGCQWVNVEYERP